MKITCSHCHDRATLILALLARNERFGNPQNDWRTECPVCGQIQEGRFPRLWKLLLSFVFLVPPAAAWALFLLYDEAIGNNWLMLFLFFVHIGVGLYAGTWLSEMIAGKLLSRRHR